MQNATASITFRPSQDAYITQFYPEINFGNEPYLYTGPYQDLNDCYRCLLKFDMTNVGSNYLPPNSTICSAYLILKIYRNELPYEIPLYAYRIYEQWDEANIMWANQREKSIEFYGKSLITPENNDYITINITDLVKGWYTGWYVNNGLILSFEESVKGLIGFYSKECPNTKYWPKLLVYYYQNCCITNSNKTCYPGIVLE
ncbi:hypothetical protein SYNTR_0879 [Candidatus Syntrophocurvum alkaliphilum]|uniref:Carbohydrate-binding module family 96 domain-containing protein n=1 Tax=Candidatus Syntrophocurvum alkaliphilum TaxID=2293317 RepID=A0A6I6DEN6_9FIRM|nr:DNRLRE domain-containing protein [Candidatus Syntrophocurvum alkaliphilum]QGT99472.1 hypothetical protein SYNTR_0879 [Candidatus Syntrophocurvum alkaliphilum]